MTHSLSIRTALYCGLALMAATSATVAHCADEQEATSVRTLLKKAKALKLTAGVDGQLVGPVSWPAMPMANKPFTTGDAAHILIKKGSLTGDYIFIFTLALYNYQDVKVSETTNALSVSYSGGYDYSLGWAMNDHPSGQPAGKYTIKSKLSVIEPGMGGARDLDKKETSITIQ